MGKADMSRRIRRQYEAIIQGDGTSWNVAYSWWNPPRLKYANAWCAFFFYKQFGRRKNVDFNRIQNIVLKGDGEVVYKWAMEIPEANLKKCHAAIMRRGTPEEIRTFAKNVRDAHRESLEAMAIVKEVLAL